MSSFPGKSKPVALENLQFSEVDFYTSKDIKFVMLGSLLALDENRISFVFLKMKFFHQLESHHFLAKM